VNNVVRLAILLFLLISLGTQPVLAGKSGKPSTPQYYTFEDLKAAAKNYRGYFSFYNYYKPSTALADLPSQAPDGGPTYVTSAKIRRMRAMFGWYNFLTFPWNDSRIQNGDIVFIRGGDAVSWVIRFFSTWTHTAMVYNKGRDETFESLINGVNTYNYKNSWRNIVAYSVKRVNISNPMVAVEAAKRLYAGKMPYFPRVNKDTAGLVDFFRKWSDKWDLDSMYCSKLVWWTFKNYVDLDSNRTSSILAGMWQSGYTDVGIWNWNAWIGVSPDDIYYSKHVGADIVIDGQHRLNEPLADSIF
jgi:hypothetical protein